MAMDHTLGMVRKQKVQGKEGETYSVLPIKRGRGRPPKNAYLNLTTTANTDLTHIRPPAKQERTFYSSDEEEDVNIDSDEDLTLMDEDDYDWKPTGTGFSAKKAAQMSNKRGPSKRGRKPKVNHEIEQIYVPKTEIKDDPDADDIAAAEEITDEPTEVMTYETIAEDPETQIVQTEAGLDGTSKILSITKKEPMDDQDPNEGVKFSVKTRAPGTDEPVEFEVELKDQKLIASGQLEEQTATVMQLLSEGNVVDAILQNLTGALSGQPQQVQNEPIDEAPNKKRWESKKFLCDDCGFTCASKTTLNTHKMFKHGDLPPKSLTCDQCDYMCDHPVSIIAKLVLIFIFCSFMTFISIIISDSINKSQKNHSRRKTRAFGMRSLSSASENSS